VAEHDAASSRSVVSRILLIDESAEVSELRKWLKARGYQVDLGHDAGQARSLVSTRRPDFVLTETLLPQETGFELCSFLKRQNEALPVVMLTEIDLDAARNLAIWCGADGYVTKPYDFGYLDRLITGVADSVWLRNHSAAGNGMGRIDFQCGCGKRLSVRQDNAGKAIQCPKCAKTVITPKFSTAHSGTWKRSKAEGADDDEARRANLFCTRCGQLLTLLQHTRDDHAQCSNCGHKHAIPRWLMDQRRFFFQPPPPEGSRDRNMRTRLRKFLMITCAQCQARYPLDPHKPETACRCPSCQTVNENPSLRNSPLAKAALISTGRMFAVAAGRTKNRKFLLPEDRELLIGADECCGLRFAERQVVSFHCALRWTDAGPMLRPLSNDAQTIVNDEVILNDTLLKAGDLIKIGSVRLLLMGNRNLDLRDDEVQSRSSDEEESLTIRDARIARQAATVLQLHWEHQREWLKQHPEWDLEEEPSTVAAAPDVPSDYVVRKAWSAADSQSSHVLLSDHTAGSPGDDTRLPAAGESTRMPQLPPMLPAVRLPDPTTCGAEEQPAEPHPANSASARELRKQRENRSADQAADIISGLFRRPPKR